jgi:hypothetical protein
VKTIQKKSILIIAIFFLFFLNTNISLAQDYRNARAYISDFGKNELFVKESLMEYSTSIIDASPDERIQTTLERIYLKLENINQILFRNDKGIYGDTDLREAFIKLNNKTIILLKNKSLKLNDYKIQSALDYSDIFKNFAYKETEITRYYLDILNYESSKRQFGLKYNIIIRAFNKMNVFEYNAYQNLIFYKLNVLDDKLIMLLKEKNIDKVNECMDRMLEIGEDSYQKTTIYKDIYSDTSLNDANIEFITFMLKQKEDLLPSYYEFVKVAEDFQKVKSKFVENNEAISVDDYNIEVRKYNKAKNLFYDTLYDIQIRKRALLDAWYKTNSLFLKNNIEFENLYEKFSSVD